MDDYICINENLIAEIEFSNHLKHMFTYMFHNGYRTSCEYFVMFCFMSTFFSLTIFLSSYIVSTYIWKPHMKKVENERVDWPFEHDCEFVSYEDKYTLDKMEDCSAKAETDDEKEALEKKRRDSNCWVTDNTPDGYVLLTYDMQYECFTYWSNKKVISYKYLETVARKYAMTVDDRGLYVSREEDIEKQKKKLKEDEEKAKRNKEEKAKRDEEQGSNKEEEEEDVFVKLKPSKKSTVVKTKNKTDIVAAINANRYKWMGKLDFNEIFKPKKEEKEENNISFASFKKMFV